MKKYEKHLHSMMQSADMETVERIAAQFPAADDAAKERIYKGIQERQRMQSVSTAYQPEYVPTVTRRHYRSIWAAAACLLICGGIVGGAAMHRPMLTQQDAETTTETTDSIESKPTAASNTKAELATEATGSIATTKPAGVLQSTEAAAIMPMETTLVTVVAEDPVQTVASEITQPMEITVQETTVQEIIVQETAAQETTAAPKVSETIPTEIQTETLQVQETIQTETTVQETFEFISLAENALDIPGFAVTPIANEFGPMCEVTVADTMKRKYAVKEFYEPTYLPKGWEYHSTHDPNGIYDKYEEQGIQRYIYDIWYKMTSGPNNGEPLTNFYLIYEQNVNEQKISCKQEYVNTSSGLVVPTDPSLYAYAETTVNGNPAFIYREDHPSTYNSRSVWYTLYWQQDGYMFSIFTGEIPESYLPELIRMAESVQPIE